jgi:hypothetical protein
LRAYSRAAQRRQQAENAAQQNQALHPAENRPKDASITSSASVSL